MESRTAVQSREGGDLARDGLTRIRQTLRGRMGSEAVVPHVWLIRAGKHGEDEELALSEGKAIIGFHEVKDLATFKAKDGLADALAKQNPTSSRPRAENYARQLWAFRETIREGDVVVLQLKSSPGQVALGRVTGAYRYVKIGGAMRHT